MHTIKYTRYPNNELRVTHYYKAERPLVNPCTDEEDFSVSFSELSPSRDEEEDSDVSTPLDISSKVSEQGEEMPHRRTKFGLNAKRTLLRLGGAYDTVDATPNHYVFLTGTIPGGTHDAFMAMAKQSSWAVKSISDWLRKTCPSKYWFYVWELQRRGALHIHYCIYAPDSGIREKILRDWHSKWHSIIQGVGQRSTTDMWIRKDGTYHKEGHSVLQAYAQEVHKSVAAYLSGYCGGSKDKHSSDAHSPYYPGRWWGCSRESTKLLRGLTEESIVEYSGYRAARREIQLAYEAISSDTPLAHHYPHKVGIGSTIVSYHPEDKGTAIWQQLIMTKHEPPIFPNCSSWIVSLEKYIQTWTLYYNALQKPREKHSSNSLLDLEDILSQGSLSRYTLSQRDLRIILNTTSVLSLNTIAQSATERTMSALVPPIWMYYRVRTHLRWNKHGWLSLENDLPVRLTDCPSWCDSSTTDPLREGDSIIGGALPQAQNPSDSSPLQLWLF